jgi:hypothetical protein
MSLSAARLQVRQATQGASKEDPRFLRRMDGTFDYHPDGLDRPGYRLNEKTRRWIAEIERAFGLQSVVCFAVVTALVYFGAQLLNEQQPALAIYADSWILRMGAAVPLAALACRVLFKIRRGQITRLLENAPPERPRLAEIDPDARFAHRWIETSLFRRLVILFGVPVMVVLLGFGALDRLVTPGSLTQWEAIVLAGFAAILTLGYSILIIRLLRSRPAD